MVLKLQLSDQNSIVITSTHPYTAHTAICIKPIGIKNLYHQINNSNDDYVNSNKRIFLL